MIEMIEILIYSSFLYKNCKTAGEYAKYIVQNKKIRSTQFTCVRSEFESRIVVNIPFISRSELGHVLLNKILRFMSDTVVDYQIHNVAAMFELFSQHKMGHLKQSKVK